MKRTFFAALAAVLLIGCSNNNNEEPQQGSTSATFRLFPTLGIETTRAELTMADMTDLWVYEGSTELAHQTSTDDDFGSPTITLDYGEHTLTIVASKAAEQAVADGAWSCTKVSPTFGKVAGLTVSAKTKAVAATLEMMSGAFKVLIDDEIPTTAKTMEVKFTPYPRSLSLSDLTASGSESYTYTIDVSSKVGKSNVSWNMYYLQARESTVDVTVKDAAGSAIVSHSLSCSLNKGESNTLHGNFFGNGSGMDLSLATDYTKTNDYDLND